MIRSNTPQGTHAADANPAAHPTVIPVAQAPFLDEVQRESLRLLLAMMIPASARHGVPGADDPLILADVLTTLRRQPEAAMDALARLHEAAAGPLADLAPEQRASAIQDFRQQHRGRAMLLVSVAVQCYYRDDRVMQSLGMEPRPPFPQGFSVEQGDWSLLDPVRARAPMWRP